MKARIILSAALLSAFLFACNKEVINDPSINGPVSSGNNGSNGNNNGNGNTGNTGNTGSSDITGTWKLVYVRSNNSVQTSYDFMGTIASSAVVMNFVDNTNAAGLYTFAANHLATKGITFRIKTTYTTTIVTSGVSGLPIKYDVDYTIPASDGESDYQLIGKDSIKVSLMSPDLSGIGTDIELPAMTSYGYAIIGDTLTLEGTLQQKDVKIDLQGLEGKVNSDTYQQLKLVRVK